MKAESILKFNGYVVEKLNFQLNKKFVHEKEIAISPAFNREIEKLDANKYLVRVKVVIGDLEYEEQPFYIEVILSGKFEVESEKRNNNLSLIKSNATAILFPYLRNAVSMLTALSNIPTLTLPVFNIVALFEEYEKKANEK
jgi:preprotein translocase subunit SecB